MWYIEKNMEQGRKKYKKLFSECNIGFSSGRVYLRDGEEVGLHSTKNGEEILTVLAGKGTATVGNREIAITDGDVLYFGPETEHNIKAVKNGWIHYIYIYHSVK